MSEELIKDTPQPAAAPPSKKGGGKKTTKPAAAKAAAPKKAAKKPPEQPKKDEGEALLPPSAVAETGAKEDTAPAAAKKTAGRRKAKAAPATGAPQPIGELASLLEEAQPATEIKTEEPTPKTAALEKQPAAPKTVWSKKTAKKQPEQPKEDEGEALLPPSAVAETGAKEDTAPAAAKKTAGRRKAKAAPATGAPQPIGELASLLEEAQPATEIKTEEAVPKTAALEKQPAAPKTVWSKKTAKKQPEQPKEDKGEALSLSSAAAETGAKEDTAPAAAKKAAGRRKAKAAPAAEGLLQASELMSLLEEEPQAEKKPGAEQAAVPEMAAQQKQPAAFKKIWSKKEGQKPLRQPKGKEKGGEPTQKPAPKEKVRAPKENKPLPAWGKPVISLALVCLAALLVAVLANTFTASFARQSAAVFENANRVAVLPAATAFEDITPSPLPANITAVYKAANDAGYVIESYGNGYGGQVPAVVGFNADGEISGVKFLANNETPGLGQSLYTHQTFAAQFTGIQAAGEISAEGIDAIAGATSSTNAAMSAVNAAVQYYYVEVQGGTLRYDISDEVLQQLMPAASTWETLDVRSSGVAGAYLGNDGTYVIVAQAAGEKQVTVAVALDQSGTILGLWLDTSAETEGIGREISENTTFINQFLDQKNTNGVDTIAGATHTTGGVIDAVDIALKALSLAKEAA